MSSQPLSQSVATPSMASTLTKKSKKSKTTQLNSEMNFVTIIVQPILQTASTPQKKNCKRKSNQQVELQIFKDINNGSQSTIVSQNNIPQSNFVNSPLKKQKLYVHEQRDNYIKYALNNNWFIIHKDIKLI